VSRVRWVSGASSAIGAAFAEAAPDPEERVINIERRPHPNPRIEHLEADLRDPESWREVSGTSTPFLLKVRAVTSCSFIAPGR
jgi:NADP-dependent 3-hydroxy acid dehydrogenase YdfG